MVSLPYLWDFEADDDTVFQAHPADTGRDAASAYRGAYGFRTTARSNHYIWSQLQYTRPEAPFYSLSCHLRVRNAPATHVGDFGIFPQFGNFLGAPLDPQVSFIVYGGLTDWGPPAAPQADNFWHVLMTDGITVRILNTPIPITEWLHCRQTYRWTAGRITRTFYIDDALFYQDIIDNMGSPIPGDWDIGNARIQIFCDYVTTGTILDVDDVLVTDVEEAVIVPAAVAPRLIRRVRQSPHLSDELGWLFFHQFQLDLDVGRGLVTGTPGTDPQVMLQWSDDGGHTWSDEHWVSAGRLGRYRHRAIWRRLGRSRKRTWRVAVADPVPWRIVDAWIQVNKGTS